MKKKVYLISLLMLALAVGAWTVSPVHGYAAQLAPVEQTAECERGVDALVGRSSELPGVQERAREICRFRLHMDQVNRVSESDRHFIEAAIAGNMLEIQSLQIALGRAQNEEWRGLIETMIAMHTRDLELALALAERLDLNTQPDLTDVRVYPGTPDYDLGMRRVNLEAKFLDPLINAAGGLPTETPTAIPTLDLTGTPTTAPTIDATSTPTDILTLVATDTPVASPTLDGTGTATDTPTLEITDTATASPTLTLTDTPTASPTLAATDTQTASPTLAATDTPTTIPTLVITDTPTAVPTTETPGSGAVANFDMVSMHIIEDEHVMHLQTAMAAQRLARNDEVRAFAKHVADVAGLHLLLMSDLKHRLFDNYTPPPPDFESGYQRPRVFEP